MAEERRAGSFWNSAHFELAARAVITACTFVLIVFAATIAPAAEPAEIRAMSFNIRFAREGHSEEATENNWNDPKHPRRERVVRLIRDVDPDLIGVQEARYEQIVDLREILPAYAFYGVGRDDGREGGEFSGIFYRKDRFTKKDAASFWLSDKPDTAGTTFSFNKLPRIASWIRLADARTNREFVLLNMHWDHQDPVAREKSAALARERLAVIATDIPAIVMGDLNSREDTPAFAVLTKGESPKLVDSYRMLHPDRMADEASFNDWRGTRKGARIDFILHTPEFESTAAEILRTSYDGLWPSDHYPVTATLRLK